jgi:hypothetical protein
MAQVGTDIDAQKLSFDGKSQKLAKNPNKPGDQSEDKETI